MTSIVQSHVLLSNLCDGFSRLRHRRATLCRTALCRATLCWTATLLIGLCSSVTADDRPNILMIMADDLGYSDLGCYGGEIETPNLDRLAESGVRFSQFYNTAKCHSSRVSLLSGQYCVAAGDVRLSHAVTSAEVLRSGGYSTAMTGKWHLSGQPTDFGFDRFFGHLSGACNYFTGDNTFRLNGNPWKVPEQGFYTTVANVDYAKQFLGEVRESADPWYLYIAFNAPHAPLHALPEDYAKYEGRYDAGWDAVREKRVEKQRRLGLFGPDVKASPRPAHIPAWSELSEARRRFEIKRMTALAAMIDRVDQEVGRLVEDLREHGELENTLICFVSDNGACPYDRRNSQVDDLPVNGQVRWSDSTGWAWARNTPFRFYKQNQFEGGICTPGIFHWPAGIQLDRGSFVRQPAHLIDLLPTFASIASAEIPERMDGRELRPVSGQSLQGLLAGDEFTRESPLHFLFASDRGIRDGKWKAVSFRSAPWELYDLGNDRTELVDLAEQHPDRLRQLVETWTQMGEQTLRASRRSIGAVSSERSAKKHPEWTRFEVDPAQRAQGGQAGNRKPASASRRRPIRARKNTTMEIEESLLRLQFSGDDPGLAFERFPADLPAGPYTLAFRLELEGTADGDLYFTTDPKTVLPRGVQVPFDVAADGQWHEQRVVIETDDRLEKLRLDVADGDGKAKIEGLRLLGREGKVLIRWPE